MEYRGAIQIFGLDNPASETTFRASVVGGADIEDSVESFLARFRGGDSEFDADDEPEDEPIGTLVDDEEDAPVVEIVEVQGADEDDMVETIEDEEPDQDQDQDQDQDNIADDNTPSSSDLLVDMLEEVGEVVGAVEPSNPYGEVGPLLSRIKLL